MKLVGVLNITPDSFSDGGEFLSPAQANAQTQKLFKDGASIVELGGQSTRPGSSAVGDEEELKRIMPCMQALSGKAFGVDTYRYLVAEQAIKHGAVYINDITGGRDPNMLHVVQQNDCEVILMHSRLTSPHEFGENPTGDIVQHVADSLARIADRALKAGISESKIVLDTGMGGFISSQSSHSFELLERYREVLSQFPFPFMLGVSRKGFLGKELPNDQRDQKSLEVVRHLLDEPKIKYLRVHTPDSYSRC